MNDTPLHERVFQIKAAIRRAGFVASGRTRMDKEGRVVMGVIVPVAFPPGDLTVEQVRTALSDRVAELQPGVVSEHHHRVFDILQGKPADLRTAEGRKWKREHAGAAT